MQNFVKTLTAVLLLCFSQMACQQHHTSLHPSLQLTGKTMGTYYHITIVPAEEPLDIACITSQY